IVTGAAPVLMRNNLTNLNGTGVVTYTDVSSTMLPASGLSVGWSSAWGDYNGDGKVDVFIGKTNSGSDTDALLRNNGAGGFTNQNMSTGLNDPTFAQNVAWADINNDHRLDMLIGMEGESGMAHVNEKHQIYLQDAAGHFSAVGAAAGFQAYYGT